MTIRCAVREPDLGGDHHDGRAGHPPTPNPTLHASFHVITENQLAAGEPAETAATLARLIAAGTTRHEAWAAALSTSGDSTRPLLADGLALQLDESLEPHRNSAYPSLAGIAQTADEKLRRSQGGR